MFMKSPGFDNNPDCSWKPMVCIALLLAFSFSSLAWAQGLSTARLDMLIGSQDSMMVLDPTGTVVYAKNEQKELVPASTLKLLTALTVFHWLGSDFHFMTDFFQDSQGNLTIKGYGDPLLISEEVNRICGLLANRINEVGDIILDDGFFADPLTIPGISNSSQPYDAPNGALCVNFNTIFFKTDGKRFVSAEPQTPLLPSALLKIQASGLKKGRIALSHQRRETTLYTGKMFRYFMKENGVAVRGRIRLGDVSANTGNKLVFHHTSPFFSLPNRFRSNGTFQQFHGQPASHCIRSGSVRSAGKSGKGRKGSPFIRGRSSGTEGAAIGGGLRHFEKKQVVCVGYDGGFRAFYALRPTA